MSALPTGTVTFLLTDIEASASLWASDPDRMELALATHDAILDHHIERHGGVVIKHRGEGDSVFAVFARPSDALQAACQVQIAMGREPWDLSGSIRIRVALHTGEAELRGGDYFGATVNRCARLRAIAHGGQTLLSSVTAQLVWDNLPHDIGLLDLGEHRLRDLTYPERVYQLLHPELPSEFPALRSLNTLKHNLPVQTVSLIGRERELREVVEHLRDPGVRLLTLTGTGGIGKTRLALQAAAELVDEFPDGVYLVDLAPITDPALVLSAVAQVFGVREAAGRRIDDRLRDFLRGKRILLVLDNFEHVLPAAGDVSGMLLACPEVAILVTSRIVLRLTGEHVYTVPPLPLPDRRLGLNAEDLIESDAVRLFVARARAVKRDFRLNADNAEAIAEICERLDGTPLAIELAAARVRLLSPQAMVRRLTSALPLLSSGARDRPSRHQTLRGAIDWSYRLLDEPHRALFRRLSVFVGGCGLDAIEAVVSAETLPGESDPFAVLDLIEGLVDASLLEERASPDGEPRFVMLRVIREYGLEQLVAAGDADDARQRHAEHFLRFAEEGVLRLESPEQAAWLERFAREHDNLRAALAWARDAKQSELYVRLAGAMFWLWFGHGHWSEGIEWMEDALCGYPEPDFWRARALFGAGRLRTLRADFERGRAHYKESIAISEQLGDAKGMARGYYMLGSMHSMVGEPALARRTLEKGLVFARQADDAWSFSSIRGVLGQLAWQAGDFATAQQYLEEAAQFHRVRGEQWSLAHVINQLGDFLRAQAFFDEADQHYEESLRLFVALGIMDGQASVLHNLGYVALNQGDVRKASELFQASLRLFQELGDRRGIAECLLGFAGILSAIGRHERAAAFFGAAHEMLDAAGAEIWMSNLNEYGRNLLTVTLALGEDDYIRAFSAGKVEPAEGIIAEALDLVVPATVT